MTTMMMIMMMNCLSHNQNDLHPRGRSGCLKRTTRMEDVDWTPTTTELRVRTEELNNNNKHETDQELYTTGYESPVDDYNLKPGHQMLPMEKIRQTSR